MKVLSIGSSLIDFFIQIENPDQIEISENKVLLPLGAKIPIDVRNFSLGGNSANVASALQKLSIPVTLYTYLGDDPLSKHIKEQVSARGVTIVVEKIDTTTGSLSLIFDFPTDRIIFSHHNILPHSFESEKLSETPDLIFLSSIGREWTDAYEKVLAYAQQNAIPIAFSPGSHQLKAVNDTFIKVARESKILLCNLDESKIINKALTNTQLNDTKELLLSLKRQGFDVLSVTDGANGAYAVDENSTIYNINSPKTEAHERTGAGDAYAAAFLAARLHGKSIEDGMRWGVLNAQGEMRQVGAGVGQLNLSEIENEAAKRSDLEVKTI